LSCCVPTGRTRCRLPCTLRSELRTLRKAREARHRRPGRPPHCTLLPAPAPALASTPLVHSHRLPPLHSKWLRQNRRAPPVAEMAAALQRSRRLLGRRRHRQSHLLERLNRRCSVRFARLAASSPSGELRRGRGLRFRHPRGAGVEERGRVDGGADGKERLSRQTSPTEQ
jgi:hypothetical protein